MAAPDITRLPEIVCALPEEDAGLFSRLYTCSVETGHLVLPQKLVAWAHRAFGNVEEQRIVRVTNRFTYESSLFNSLRAKRPLQAPPIGEAEEALRLAGTGLFSRPLDCTPVDVFGRIPGKYCITAANIAKYDCLHSLIIFEEPDPFVVDESIIADILDVAERWFLEAHRNHPASVWPFFLWNCLWRAGASIIHGHAQVLLSPSPYGRQALMGAVGATYRHLYGSEFLDDISAVHEALDLSMACGRSRVMAYLTPVKEREAFIVAPGIADLAQPISTVLACYRNLGVRSFNVGIFPPPIGEKGDCYARIVDRGDLSSRTSDIGGMELYAGTAVISADPFRLIDAFRSV